jgi:hypothetical protein
MALPPVFLFFSGYFESHVSFGVKPKDACKSGSEVLEVGSEGEIPVKVSRGEFIDDFLIDRR